ncbi:MAG: SUMF1/EgtB/PvdO family nonheme iron enzyme [Phycisphaeraceae bacterium]|nr:SUMF1/EgtB/PvdO family nonheme iron enzyme [Phycisphaeraceae bacterium]
MRIREVIAPSAAAVVCAGTLASHPITTIHGHEFVTVGAPGNAAISVPQSNGFGPMIDIGRVEHSFRITRHEVTVRQWLGFLDAYRPHLAPSDYNDPQFSGYAAQYAGVGADGLPQYQVHAPQFANYPVTPSWTYVARFMNWMHNGAKPIHEATYDDFHTGAYNMNDFGSTTPVVRQEGARFFIPNFDEWTKAVYYDPDRYGEGQPGYWLYPHQSDDAPIPGPPPPDGNGQTSGGNYAWGGTPPPPVGAYGIETPWGLLDASGSQQEWTETYAMDHPSWNTPLNVRPVVGSYATINGNSSGRYDELGYFLGQSASGSLHGFRIATVIPAPSAGAVFVSAMAFAARRRR